jgi:glyceraldehyde 3-phosphate dehydrogenase
LEQAGLVAPVKFDPVLSAVVDAPSTMVTDGTALKVYAWYDNEMGYACRMVDQARHMERVGL